MLHLTNALAVDGFATEAEEVLARGIFGWLSQHGTAECSERLLDTLEESEGLAADFLGLLEGDASVGLHLEVVVVLLHVEGALGQALDDWSIVGLDGEGTLGLLSLGCLVADIRPGLGEEAARGIWLRRDGLSGSELLSGYGDAWVLLDKSVEHPRAPESETSSNWRNSPSGRHLWNSRSVRLWHTHGRRLKTELTGSKLYLRLSWIELCSLLSKRCLSRLLNRTGKQILH